MGEGEDLGGVLEALHAVVGLVEVFASAEGAVPGEDHDSGVGKVERQESLEEERVSVLVGLVQEVKGSLRSLESEIRRARKSPAFSSKAACETKAVS